MSVTVLAFLPIFQISRLLGLISFVWPDEKFKPCFHRKLSSLILFSIFIFSVVSQVIVTLERLEMEVVTMDIVAQRIQMAFCTATVLILTLNSILQAPRARRMILALINVDHFLQNSAFHYLENKIKYLLISYLLVWVILFLSFSLSKGPKPIMYIPYLLCVLIMLIAEQHIISLTIIIKNRFQYINKKIKSLKQQSVSYIWAVKSKNTCFKGAPNIITRLRKSHADLCDILRDFDGIYRSPMVAILITHFFIIVGGLYFLFVFATGSGYLEKNLIAKRFTMFASITLFSSLRIILIAYVCNETMLESRRTGELLYRMEWQADTADEIKIFVGQLQLERVAITCGGMFPVDLSLLYVSLESPNSKITNGAYDSAFRGSIMIPVCFILISLHLFIMQIGGAVTSYLVILIQFQSVTV